MKKCLYLFLMLVCFSCQQHPYSTDVMKTLLQAGDNRNELIKVLEYYKERDSLKYEAACFLIGNMCYHQSLEQYTIDPAYFGYFTSIDSILREDSAAVTNDYLRQNLAEAFRKLPVPKAVKGKADIEVLSAGYIIKNIEQAFEMWEKSPLLKNMSFEEFKEWILPYRTGEEALTHNKDALNKIIYNKLSVNGMEDIRKPVELYKEYIHSQHRMTSFIKSANHIGFFDLYLHLFSDKDCDNQAIYTCNLFRACGIPVVYEFTPQWQAEDCGHFWCVSPDSSGVPQPYTPPYNNLGEDWDWNIKNAGKVYRINYGASFNNPYFVRNKNEEVPPVLASPLLEDVTEHYHTCTDITSPLAQMENNLTYLCFFNRGQLNPVAWGEVNHDKKTVTYCKVPFNMLFFAAYLKKSKLIPLGNPFYLQKDCVSGKVSKKEVSISQNKRKLHLFRKYPPKPRLVSFRKNIKGSCLTASNYIGGPYDTIFVLDNIPASYWQEYKINNSKKYRYYKFSARSGISLNLVEFEFLGNRDAAHLCSKPASLPIFSAKEANIRNIDLVKIKGTPIQDTDSMWLRAYDENLETYVEYSSLEIMDFETPVCITHIRLLPRNAMNTIEPNCRYLLLYYKDNKWTEHQIQKAIYNYIDFDQVPEGTIYWLRNLDKGKEELPFFYWEGKQVFINTLNL